MHEKDIITMLGVARGEVDAPLHRSALRRAVLTQSKRFTPLQNFVTLVSMNKYYVSLGSVVAVVAIALIVSVSPLSTHVASAQEQVQRAYARAIKISPAMRAQLESNMKADMLKTLEEAKAAPDLKIMTKEEFEKDGQFTFSTGPGPMGVHGMATASFAEGDGPHAVGRAVAFSHSIDAVVDGEAGVDAGDDVIFTASTRAPEELKEGTFSAGTITAAAGGPGHSFSAPVKYLSYTDPEGHKTVLGLDENDTPVFKMSTLNASDVKDMGNGMIGIEGKAIQVMHMGPDAGVPSAQ